MSLAKWMVGAVASLSLMAVAESQVVRPKIPPPTPPAPLVGPPTPVLPVKPGVFRGLLISLPAPERTGPRTDLGVRALPSQSGGGIPGPMRAAAIKIAPPPDPFKSEVVGQITIRIQEDGRVRAVLNDQMWCVAVVEGRFDSQNEFHEIFEAPEWGTLKAKPLTLDLKVQKGADDTPRLVGKVSFEQIAFYVKFEAERVADPTALPTGYYGVPKLISGLASVEATFTIRPRPAPGGKPDEQFPASVAADLRVQGSNATFHTEGQVDNTGWFGLLVKDARQQVVATLVGYLVPAPAWAGEGSAIVYRLFHQDIDGPNRDVSISFALPARAPSPTVQRPRIRPPLHG